MTKRLSSLLGTHFILQNKNIFISVLHNFSHIWTLSPIPSKLEMNYSTTIVVITKFCHLLISHRRSLTRCHCWSTHKSLSRTSHPINSKTTLNSPNKKIIKFLIWYHPLTERIVVKLWLFLSEIRLTTYWHALLNFTRRHRAQFHRLGQKYWISHRVQKFPQHNSIRVAKM